MPMLNFHPAPGLGDLPPGWFDVPQNPLRPDSTPLVPTVRAAVGNRITKKPTMGDLLPGAMFTVPQNPLTRNPGMAGLADLVPGASFTVPQNPMGMSGMGCGCGCPPGGVAPSVGLGEWSPGMVVTMPGEAPFRHAFPPFGGESWWDARYQPVSMYAQPSTEDMQSYGMAGLTMDGTGLLGTGLFSSGMDLSGWGAGEYVAAGLGAYTLYSIFFTTKSGVRQAHSSLSGAARGFRSGMSGGRSSGSRFNPKRRK